MKLRPLLHVAFLTLALLFACFLAFLLIDTLREHHDRITALEWREA